VVRKDTCVVRHDAPNQTYLVGFEEKHNRQHSQSSLALDSHSQDDEDDAAQCRHEHDIPRLDIQQQPRGREPTSRKHTLANRIPVTRRRGSKMRHVLGVRDELRRNGHLGADVAELRCDGEHEFFVLPDRLFGVAG